MITATLEVVVAADMAAMADLLQMIIIAVGQAVVVMLEKVATVTMVAVAAVDFLVTVEMVTKAAEAEAATTVETAKMEVMNTEEAVVVIALPTMEVAAAVRPEAAAREQAVFVFCNTLSTLNKGVITYENIPDCR